MEAIDKILPQGKITALIAIFTGYYGLSAADITHAQSLPFPDKGQSLESIEPEIASFQIFKDSVLILPKSKNLTVVTPFSQMKLKNPFGNLLDSKRFAFKTNEKFNDWEIITSVDNKIFVVDGRNLNIDSRVPLSYERYNCRI